MLWQTSTPYNGVKLPLPLVDRSKQQIEQKIRKKVESLKDVKGIKHVTVRLSASARVPVLRIAAKDWQSILPSAFLSQFFDFAEKL